MASGKSALVEGSAAWAGEAVSAAAAPASAYPIFAQQNYANPREATGKIACANCHLQGKYIEVKMPHEVLPDTIFKTLIEVPCKYEKRVQPIADGSKASLNAGAIAIMPEGWKLAPKDRLPKALKKQMKGLAWAPYSKDKPNIVVAGPVPGKIYENMVLPLLKTSTMKGSELVVVREALVVRSVEPVLHGRQLLPDDLQVLAFDAAAV